jgi:hypothetical protein
MCTNGCRERLVINGLHFPKYYFFIGWSVINRWQRVCRRQITRTSPAFTHAAAQLSLEYDSQKRCILVNWVQRGIRSNIGSWRLLIRSCFDGCIGAFASLNDSRVVWMQRKRISNYWRLCWLLAGTQSEGEGLKMKRVFNVLLIVRYWFDMREHTCGSPFR